MIYQTNQKCRKRNQSLLRIAAFLMIAAFSMTLPATAQQSFRLTGTAGHANAPGKAYLLYKNGETTVTDSTELHQGHFQFVGTLQEPTLARLIVDHDGIGFTNITMAADMTMLFLESGTLTIPATDSIKNAKVEGSPLNDVYAEFLSFIQPQRDALDAVQGRRHHGAAALAKASQDYRDAEFEFIRRHPDSYVSFYLLRAAAMPVIDPVVIGPLYRALSPQVRETAAGRAFGHLLARRQAISIGNQAPDFVQNDVNGKPVHLSDFRGQYVLIDFWASWCVPCRAENPNVVKAYNLYKDQGFTVIGVSLDRPGRREDWLKAIEKDGLTWTNVSDLQYWDNEVAQLYGVRSIPQNVLLDKNGVIIARNLRGEDLRNTLAELLSE